MRSRAHIKTHPLHPILIPFPIAFFTATLVFDILGIVRESEQFHILAGYLLIGGVGMGLVAAIPGLVDFLYTVPPHSSARKRATTHGLLNGCMIALFIVAWILRDNTTPAPTTAILLLETSGVILMMIAGWLGGTLVHRNQIGIDPRYASAGKWRELHLKAAGGRVELGRVDDLQRDQMMLVHVSGKRIVVARTDDGLVAFDDHCTHKGGSLAGGMMMCDTVQCPWHGSQFDVNTGAVKAGPAKKSIPTYTIRHLDNVYYLILGD